MILAPRLKQSTAPALDDAPDSASNADEPCASCEARLLSVCKAVPESDLARLAEAADVVDLNKGQVLLREDDPSEHLFNVTSGALKLYKLLPDGRRQVLGFLFKGDFLGLSGRATNGLTAEALTAVRLCRFPRQKFVRLIESCAAMERELLDQASSDLSAAQEQMLLLGRKTARERVASFLVGLSAREARLGTPSGHFHLPMTRTDIADYLGLTTETVSRVVTEFRRRGLIRLDGSGMVHLLDPARLEVTGNGHGLPG